MQTGDLVIPNAALGCGQAINCMSPDPTYRVETDLHVTYESDFDRIQLKAKLRARLRARLAIAGRQGSRQEYQSATCLLSKTPFAYSTPLR